MIILKIAQLIRPILTNNICRKLNTCKHRLDFNQVDIPWQPAH